MVLNNKKEIVRKIKEASIEDLIQVKGINLALAEKIKEEL